MTIVRYSPPDDGHTTVSPDTDLVQVGGHERDQMSGRLVSAGNGNRTQRSRSAIWFSIVLSITAQLILSAVIFIGTVPVGIALAAIGSVLVASLILIAAEHIDRRRARLIGGRS